MSAVALSTLVLAIAASGEVNVVKLDGAKVTRLIVHAGDGSVTRGTVATGSLGPAILYDSEPSEYITGCWDHTCVFGIADEMRLANLPQGGGELSSYTFSYAAGYGFVYEFCIPGDPAGGGCDCYCPTGGECDEGDPPYTIDAALYDGPPGFCGGGLPIAGTEAEIVTTASRPLGDEHIEVRVDLEPKVFVPPLVWAVVTFDIEDAWMVIGSAPTFGSTSRDGAQWEDIDADGCWDEWECWDHPYPWGCPGCTGWMHLDAEANAERTISLIPVSADAPPEQNPVPDGWRISGNEIILDVPGRPVWVEIRFSDWYPNQTGMLMKAWQVCIDPSSFTKTEEPPEEPPECASDDDCLTTVGWGSYCEVPQECLDAGFTCQQCAGIGMPCLCTSGLSLSLFHMTDCATDEDCETALGQGATCNDPTWPPDSCTPAFIDHKRTDYIFPMEPEISAVYYSGESIAFGSTLTGPGIGSPGDEMYGGTLVLAVPSAARGTFEVTSLMPPCTVLVSGDNEILPLLGLVPAKITVQTGACCFGLGTSDKKQGCIEDVTASECEAVGLCKGTCADDPTVHCQSDLECELAGVSGFCIGGATLGQTCAPFPTPLGEALECDATAGDTCVVQGHALFSPGSACTGDPCSDCGTCIDDLDCDDGNLCTRDTCDAEVTCTCRHTPDYDLDTECCNPDTGVLEPLDDGDPCTLLGICDAQTGEVTHPAVPPGATCDDGDECTTDDQCDGTGECVGEPIPGRPCTDDGQCAPGACVDGVCQCPAEFVPVPAVSGWGAVIVALVLIVLGKIYFGRRRSAG